MRDVLILGGYGNFGKRIATALAQKNIPIIIAGRNANKAQQLAAQILKTHPNGSVRAEAFDAERDLDAHLKQLRPAVVVNTCGPFQNKDYRIAQACIAHGVHYIDLADGRSFVTGIAR